MQGADLSTPWATSRRPLAGRSFALSSGSLTPSRFSSADLAAKAGVLHGRVTNRIGSGVSVSVRAGFK